MSLFERRPVLRRFLTVSGAALLAVSLGGCFRPLYGDISANVTGTSITVREALAQIEVPEVKDRIGHYLRNELVFDLDGSGAQSNVPKRFLLSLSVKESLDVIVVDYSTGRADAAALVATATYELFDRDKGKQVSVTKGTVTARASYDRSAQRFASIRAARDAQIRTARALSGQIRNLLAARLASGA
jgi:LPS-assembly lipoprotein